MEKQHFRLKPAEINGLLLQSQKNMDAAITLTKVRHGFFLNGDQDDSFRIKWRPNDLNCRMHYSTRPGSRILTNYPNATEARGTGDLLLNPAKENMSTGVYYCILVAEDDPAKTSVEFKVIVQAAAVASAIEPQGTVNVEQGAPLFRWTPVDGVPYYFVFLSEGPLSIDRDDEGKVVGLSGLNLIWQVITPGTSIKFGDPDPSDTFSNVYVPPLLPNIEYNWIVLNSYAPNSELVSGEVAPVGPWAFQVTRSTLAQTPERIQPASDGMITDDEITFKWTPVAGATRYRFYLYEGRIFQSSDIDYSMFSQVTTEAEIKLRAKGFLVTGRYHWRIVAENSNSISASERYPFEYNGSAGWVHFRVTTPESLLSRVEIKIRDEANGENLLPFLTDSVGVMTQGLPVGTYSYTASRSEFLTSPRAYFEISKGDTTLISLDLKRGAQTVSGRILTDAGSGLFDAIITLTSGNQSEAVRSDEAGYFTAALPPGTWALRVHKSGYVTSTMQTLTLLQDEPITLDDIMLQVANNTVSGEVTFAADSRPLQGAFVRAQQGDIVFETTSNNQGRFQFKLGPGEWLFKLDPQGFFASPSEVQLSLTENEQISLPFRLFSGSLIYGRVRFKNKGLSDASIKAFHKENGDLVQTVTSDVQGQYNLGLKDAGEYELAVSRENFLEVRTDISIDAGQSLVQDFTMTEAGFLKGTVKNADTFESVAGVNVFAVEDSTRTSTSDFQGRYVLSLPPEQTFTINIDFPGFALKGDPVSVTVASGDTSTQDLFIEPLSGIIQGQVTDGSVPVPDAEVKIVELQLQVLTNETGEFEFEVAPGNYTISVSKSCHVTKKRSVEVVAGMTESLSIDLPALPSVITGTVKDTRGQPLDGAEITATSDTTFTTESDSSGYYELCLNEGTYHLQASHLGYVAADTTIGISAGDSLGGINFILPDNFARLSGTVVDTSRHPIADALVTVTNANQTLSTTTNSNGAYSIDRIYPGLTEIKASKIGFFGKALQIFLQGQQSTELDLKLYPADGFIRGIVLSAEDSVTAIADVTIEAVFSEEPDKFITTTTNLDGRYALTDLPVVPNASYTVFASKTGFVRPAPLSGVFPKTQGVNFYMLNRNAVIEGVVLDVDTRAPIVNARIEVTHASGGRAKTQSDSSGKFMLSNLIPNEFYGLSVNKDGYFKQDIPAVAAGDTTVLIELLRRYAFITGKVVDTTGIAMPDIHVYATPKPGSRDGKETIVRTDQDGKYQLKLIADEYDVRPLKFNHRSEPSFIEVALTEDSTVADLNFVLEPQNVQSITIARADNSTEPSISNLQSYCFLVTARDEHDRPVNISTPVWQLDVSANAATIDSIGCVQFNPNFFGDLTISAVDPISGIEGELKVDVVATIDSTTETTLVNDRGLQLEITRNAVSSQKELQVTRQPLASAKKGRAEFVTNDSSYIFLPKNFVFQKGVKLMLPSPPNTEDQNQFIGRWDGEASEWKLIEPQKSSKKLTTATILETGEYTAIAISKPLSIEHISILPNPFSPMQEIDGHPGLRIQFDLSSNAAPNPLFTIKIYNLEGNLVRLLHDQTPFPRGHSTVYWDGKADNGAYARNGRYLIRFIVEDPADRAETMKSVVLIK